VWAAGSDSEVRMTRVVRGRGRVSRDAGLSGTCQAF